MDALNLRPPGVAGTVSRGTPNRGSPDTVERSGPLLTSGEYDGYVEELGRLREVRDRDLPELLRDARTFVANDAAEEIIQIQEDQAVVDARIAWLEELVRTAQVVADDIGPQVVSLGRTVAVEYVRTGKVVTYRVAGVPPSSDSGTVSAGSPIGAALMGGSPGDVVVVELPNGRLEELRILDVLSGERAG